MKINKPNIKIDFSQIQWEVVMKGLRQKVVESETKRIRLVEFSEGFEEEEWCQRPHLGYVLEGCFCVQFEEELIEFQQGDGLNIQADQKHKAIVKAGQKALLYLLD